MLDDDLIDDLWADASSATDDSMDVHQFARAVERAAYEAAIKACNNERVDAESTGAKEDYAYNAAIRHCADAIRSLMEQPK